MDLCRVVGSSLQLQFRYRDGFGGEHIQVVLLDSYQRRRVSFQITATLCFSATGRIRIRCSRQSPIHRQPDLDMPTIIPRAAIINDLRKRNT